MQESIVVEELRPDAEAPVEAPACRHHWRIESPNGATSNGVCKLCGAVKEFSNSSSDSIWENENSDGGNRWRGRGRGGNNVVSDVPASSRAPAPISESTLGRLLGVGFRGSID
jgi:hypothetical protein